MTEPAGANVSEATAIYAVLPIEEGSLWNPTPYVTDGPSHVTRELQYDAFVGRWVAQFELPYPMRADSPFAWVEDGGNAASRSFRFELDFVGEGQIIGSVSDRWSGLFEARSAAGILQPRDIVFEGTLDLMRVAAPPAHEDVLPPVAATRPAATTLPLPIIDACDTVTFDAVFDVGGPDEADCATIATTADFLAAAPAEREACAIAMAEVALTSGTTAQQIVEFLDDTTPNPGGQSFSDFLRDCAAQKDGTCVPTGEVLCARQLSAYVLKTSSDTSPRLLGLLSTYQRTTHEAFLGRQFAAFHDEAQTRLDWLEAQDYPAIVTTAVQSFVAGLLDDWRARVLDTHIQVLVGQFDASGSAIFSQQITDTMALAKQRELLFEVTQSWRGAADSLALGAARWDVLLTDLADRQEVTTLVYERMIDLYVLAGVLAELNRQAGAGGNNAVFQGGFQPLVRTIKQLSLPFDRLIYERQAEVVVSTSLDPLTGNETLLANLADKAQDEVASADAAVSEVIAEAANDLLDQGELTTGLVNEAQALEASITELCGLPAGCTAPDEGRCRPNVAIARCGFRLDATGTVVDAFPEDANVSEAGAALLEIRQAMLGLELAEEAVRAHTAQANLYFETSEAFAVQVEAWNVKRRDLTRQIAAKVATLKGSRDSTLAALAANFEEQAAEHERRLGEQASFSDQWTSIEVNGVRTDFKALDQAYRLSTAAAALNSTADAIDQEAIATLEGLPKVAGTSTDPSAGQRFAVLLYNYYATTVIRVGAAVLKTQATTLERQVEYDRHVRDATLASLELDNDLNAAASEAKLNDLYNRAALVQAATELEQGVISELIGLYQQETEAALAYERDLVELRDRRDEYHSRLIDAGGLRIQVAQADLTIKQALAKYARVVQSAQLLEGRLLTVRAQLQNINQILGSPAAVFAWSNRLERAEQRLERAKDALRDWLLALEYFAVRPFFDQRIQILLARNTTQLEAIAAELERLQRSCGGAVNTLSVDVSVRKDLLAITSPMVDLQNPERTVSPEQRFRDVLAVGAVPIDKRVRYSTDENVGDLISRGGVMAATFDIGVNDFANLGNTCNAKIASVGISLVGEGLGDALPTVSLLYDGTSRLRSCQPDIRDIVALVGSDVTPFSVVTTLKTAGRSISPVAGVNEFPAGGTQNRSLANLPLVSQYTILIDPSAGENRNIDWTRLEDVLLRVEYTYQDLFPVGQCQ